MGNRKEDKNFLKYFIILYIFMLLGAITKWLYGYGILLYGIFPILLRVKRNLQYKLFLREVKQMVIRRNKSLFLIFVLSLYYFFLRSL